MSKLSVNRVPSSVFEPTITSTFIFFFLFSFFNFFIIFLRFHFCFIYLFYFFFTRSKLPFLEEDQRIIRKVESIHNWTETFFFLIFFSSHSWRSNPTQSLEAHIPPTQTSETTLNTHTPLGESNTNKKKNGARPQTEEIRTWTLSLSPSLPLSLSIV